MRSGHHAVQQVAILGRCLRSAWWLRVRLVAFLRNHTVHVRYTDHLPFLENIRPPSIFGKHPLQKLSFRDTPSQPHEAERPTCVRPSFRDIRTDPRPTSAVHVRYIRYTSWTGGDRLTQKHNRGGGARVLPLVVHQKTWEELGN